MGDWISRSYLLDVILVHNFHGSNKNIVPYADRRGYRQRDREVREAIINAPSVTPMSKTGIDWNTEENPEDADAYLVTWGHPRYKGSRFIGICEWDGQRWLVEDMEQSKLYSSDPLIIKAWADVDAYKGDVE